MRWPGLSALAAAAMVLLPGCKGTKAPAGPPVNVVIHHASYDAHSDTPNVIKDKCKFHQELAEAIHELTPGSSVSTGSSALVLSPTVVTMRGVDPKWQGDAKVIVRGELRDGGTMVGSFRIAYSAEAGLTGGVAARCAALDTIAQYMAEDIAPWLRTPEMNTKMGE